MRNFYDETVVAIYELAGKTISDIEYITMGNFENDLTPIDWDTFVHLAKQLEYNPKVEGEPIVYPAIRIGGKNWYLFRTIKNGIECWSSIETDYDEEHEHVDLDPFDLINFYLPRSEDNERYKFIDVKEDK